MINITPENISKLRHRKTCKNQTDLVRLFVEVAPFRAVSGYMTAKPRILTYKCYEALENKFVNKLIATRKLSEDGFIEIYVPAGNYCENILGMRGCDAVARVAIILCEEYRDYNQCPVNIRFFEVGWAAFPFEYPSSDPNYDPKSVSKLIFETRRA